MKKNIITLLMFLCALFLLPSFLSAADFFLTTNQYAGIDPKEDKTNFEYQANILPAFSHFFNDSSEIFLSAGVKLGCKEELTKENFRWVPEILRAEFSWQQNNVGIRAGRFNYTDISGIIASGLFDGLSFSYTSMAGTISLGAWYTGLLYKETANIIMNDTDLKAYNIPVDYDDFSNTYFASRRLLASLDWEHPSIGNFMELKAAVTAQFDLSDPDEEKYHSQYITLKAIIPVNRFDFEFGGSLGISQKRIAIETDQETPETDTGIALAGNFSAIWRIPSSFNSHISLTGCYLSGNLEQLKAFIPLSNRSYGDILKLRLPGISLLSLGYSAQVHSTLGIGFGATHFIRNDLSTFKVDDDSKIFKQESVLKNPGLETEGNSLGTEFFARIAWKPLSDLQLSMGGGIFLPSLGNMAPDKNPLWLAELSVTFVLY